MAAAKRTSLYGRIVPQTYAAHNGKDRKVFDAEEWLATNLCHPERHDQVYRFQGDRNTASSEELRLVKFIFDRCCSFFHPLSFAV
jgi:hypothetical protein